MRFSFTEDQLALRDAVRDLLAKECPPEVVRAAWPEPDADGQGPGAGARSTPEQLAAVWHHLAEMGVLGLLVPEDRGGLGFDEVAAALVLEETGYVAVPHPVVETVCVAAPVLRPDVASHQRLDEVLAGPGADGDRLASVVAVGGVRAGDAAAPGAVRAEPSGEHSWLAGLVPLQARCRVTRSPRPLARPSPARRLGSAPHWLRGRRAASWRSTGRRWAPRRSSSGCPAGCSTSPWRT